MARLGGASTPIYIDTDGKIGTYVTKVEVVGPEDGPISGGNAVTVVPVTDLTNKKLIGGKPIKVVLNDEVGRGVSPREVMAAYAVVGSLYWDVITADTETLTTGVTVDGNPAASRKCDDNAFWGIQEEAGGLEVEFSFTVQGNGQKVKFKGKASTKKDYTIRAWNGSSWDDIQDVTFNTSTGFYSITLGDQYTNSGVVQVQVYKTPGNNDIIYLDCIYVIDDAPVPGALPDYDYLLSEGGDDLLWADGTYIELSVYTP